MMQFSDHVEIFIKIQALKTVRVSFIMYVTDLEPLIKLRINKVVVFSK